jgi:hypothetical protein
MLMRALHTLVSYFFPMMSSGAIQYGVPTFTRVT